MKTPSNLVGNDLGSRLRSVRQFSKIICDALDLPNHVDSVWAVKNLADLTILTNDSILATQIRLRQQELQANLKRLHGLDFRSITVKMQSQAIRREKPLTHQAKRTMPSADSRKVIQSIAQNIQDDELRESLMRLGNYTPKKPKPFSR